MNNQRQYILSILENLDKGKQTGARLVYDKYTKKLRPEKRGDDPNQVISITPSDMIVSH
ncbi:MAG: hypothetical protein JXR73_16220 [Candidatus Omnitrophica bacterium]|nr:hypothetical protein [Candidatus Omnitrophota bacterium]